MNTSLLESFHYPQGPILLHSDLLHDQSGSKESSQKPNIPSSHADDVHDFNSFFNGISSIPAFPEQCKKHSKDIEYVCLTDKKKICADCMAFGDHPSGNHVIQRLGYLKESGDSKRKPFEDLLSNMSLSSKDTEQIIEEKMRAMLDLVENKFTDIQSALDTKKAQFIDKINLLHDQEIARVHKEIGEDSLTRQVITRRINADQDIIQSDNPFEILDEDPLNLLKVIQKAVQPEKANKINQCLQEIQQNIDSTLTDQLSALQQIPVLIPEALANEDIDLELDEKASLIEELHKYNSLLKNRSDLQCPGESSFIIDPKKIKISYPFHVCSHHNLNTTIEGFGSNISVLKFKISSSIEELSQEDISFLSSLRKKLPNIQEIHLTVWNHHISDDILQTIFACLFWKNDTLKGIFLKCYKKEPFEKTISYFAETILPAAKNLQKFSFYFEFCQMSNETFSSLNQAVSKVAQNLTDFYFVCGGQDIDAVSLKKLFVPMPNLKIFTYQTLSQAFDYEVLEAFTSQTLSSFKSLSEFKLFLPNSELTDLNVKKLFKSFPEEWSKQIAKFKINLKNAQIADETLNACISNSARVKSYSGI